MTQPHADEEDRRRISTALAWIADGLRRHGVSHQAVGGLAARAYGARRPLVDIDFYVPFDEAADLLEEVRPFVVWGPEHHTGDKWDLTYLEIDYHGQRIELGDSSSDPRYFNAEDGRWERQRIDFGNSTTVRGRDRGDAERRARPLQAAARARGGPHRRGGADEGRPLTRAVVPPTTAPV